mgnify:CR=1 FL=1
MRVCCAEVPHLSTDGPSLSTHRFDAERSAVPSVAAGSVVHSLHSLAWCAFAGRRQGAPRRWSQCAQPMRSVDEVRNSPQHI